MRVTAGSVAAGSEIRRRDRGPGPRYKWIALSNTTLGVLMATINQSIVLIALPDIFRGIGLNPLASGNTGYLLWMLMGFLVVSAVLVVTFGRLGDMFGRVRMYNLGFAIFTVASILLAVTWMHGVQAALWLIGWRIVQGIGGAFLFANSTAILTDAFPAGQRGTALGMNAIAAIAGSFFGLLLGGVLAPHDWHLVFLVSVPFGVFGTVWAYFMLRDQGVRQPARMDWWGNVLFAAGLISILVGITYGLEPYKTHTMGWTSPWVLAALIGGAAALAVFAVVETKVADPLFRLSLFRIRAFAAGNVANLLVALGRGGMQFILIIWLQGIWLPLHGYDFAVTPLWAGIYMVPLTIGFLVSAPLSGVLSDRFGARGFTVGGALLTAGSFLCLFFVPVDFRYPVFAAVLVINGFGSGLFASPNRAEIMNSVPANQRGAAGGMIATFQNTAFVLSIGIFFTLIVTGLAGSLPTVMSGGLVAQGVPAAAAHQIAHLPPIALLFSAFLGYNPMKQLLGSKVLSHLPAGHAAALTSHSFFPHLISAPFHDGLSVAFAFAIAANVVAALASALTRSRKPAALTTAGPATAGQASTGPAATPVPANGAQPSAAPASPADTGAGAAGLSVRGVVRDRHGSPVPGAVLTALRGDGWHAGRAVAAADGGYELTDLPPVSFTLVTQARGRAPHAALVAVGAGGVVSHDVVLAGESGTALLVPEAEVHGVVRDPSDTPLSGVTVSLANTDGEVVASTVTDADGTYRLTGLDGGEHTLVASGYQPVTAVVRVRDGHASSVTVRLGQPPDASAV
jgi:MFS family permease